MLIPLLIMAASVVAVGTVATVAVVQNNKKPQQTQTTTTQTSSNTNQKSTNTSVNTKTNQATNANAQANTNVSTNANVAVDETAGWKTYTNAEFGYSIKYPADWPIEPDSTATKSAVTIGNIPNEPSAGPFTVYVKKNDTDVRAFITSYRQGYPDGCGAEQEVTIDGERWIALDCKEAFAGQNKKSYFVSHNGSIFHIYFIEGSGEINETFQKILSTLRFTE